MTTLDVDRVGWFLHIGPRHCAVTGAPSSSSCSARRSRARSGDGHTARHPFLL